jgi:hypothetical protein
MRRAHVRGFSRSTNMMYVAATSIARLSPTVQKNAPGLSDMGPSSIESGGAGGAVWFPGSRLSSTASRWYAGEYS